MIQEETELLLKDLCARLPYGVKIRVNDKIETVEGINILDNIVEFGTYMACDIDEVKPYLFPMSSMTDEQWRELFATAGYEVREEDCGRHTEMYYYQLVGHENELYPNSDAIDWLNKNHFDYRGLIEKGLALDATGKDIY